MSNILISTPPTSLATGLLQLDGGVAMSSTPVYVADQTNTDSKLALSTTSVNVNTLTGSALVNIKGTGASSSTTSLLVQNSAGNSILNCTDDGKVYIQSNTLTVSGYSARINNLQLGLIGSKVISSTGGDSSINIDAGGVGISGATALTPTARVHIKGSGSTSATTSLLVQDSASTSLMLVRDDGNVGIGTSSPSSKLHVVGNVTIGNVGSTSPSEPLMVKTATAFYFPAIKVEDYNTEQGLYMQTIIGLNAGVGTGRYYNSGAWRSDVTNPTNIRFDGGIIRFYAQSGVTADADYTPSERMSITSTGNVGIGTTSPSAKLDVNGDLFSRGVIFGYAGAGNQYGGLTWSSTDSGNLFLKSANTTRVLLDSNGVSYLNGGNVGIGTTTPNLLGVTKELTLEAKSATNQVALNLSGYATTSGTIGSFLQFYNNANRVAYIGSARGSVDNSSDLFFANANAGTLAQNMVIKASGNVGIGTTSPTSRIQVQGSGTTSATSNLLLQNSSSTQLVKVTDDGKMTMGTGTTGTALLDIAVGSGSTPPLRLKGYSDAGTSYLISAGTESFQDGFKVKMVNGNVTMGTQLNGYTFGLETFNGVAMHIANAGNIGMGTTSPNVSAKLDVNSTTQGFLPPVMTTAQKTAIGSPSKGLIVFDSSLNKLCVYNGGAWETITSV